MTTRWAGVVASGKVVRIVAVDENDTGTLVYAKTETCPLPDGDRCSALEQVHTHVSNALRTLKVQRVAILDTAAGRNMGLAHLHGAELRGVVKAAASTACKQIQLINKGAASKTFGSRKVEEYVSDADWFAGQIGGAAMTGLDREAAFCILVARKPKTSKKLTKKTNPGTA